MNSSQQPSYFDQRIFGELGLTPEQITRPLQWPAIHDMKSWHDTKLFDQDKEGNILITVFDVDRNVVTYKPDQKEKEYYNRYKPYQITRYKTPKTFADKTGTVDTQKYHIPKGAGTHPYFPYILCEKYAKAEKINTLILTEGAFKATKGALCGLDMVGFSSITHNKDKETQTMYADVLKIIKKCDVENIIILFDGDCRQISTKDLEAKRELSRRPKGFFNQIIKCRELLKDLDKNIWFATIKSDELKNNPKGIDDLLISENENTQAVVEDLLVISRPNHFFKKIDVTYNTGKLYKWFNLSKVEEFYNFHQQAIGTKQFMFSGAVYEYDEEKEELKKIVPAEAKNYVRVGDKYCEFVLVPNKYNQLEKQLHTRQKRTIIDDYGVKFLDHIPKYKAFCNVPNHVHYQPVISDCFNRYYEFEHEPEEGECPLTLDFLQHIFGEQYELGIDYIQLLYQQPQQKLPILCLVSRENKTGKSTFVELMKAIFTNNCATIGNAELSDQFNAVWATRLIIACEESFIDKKIVVEKIKALSTGNKIIMNQKGIDHVEVDFFGKFILCSNNEENFIIASKQDTRYWVRKIPMPQKEQVNLLKLMIQEIPHFLYFLNKRKLSTENKSRMWFSIEDIHTEAFDQLAEHNLREAAKEIRDKVRQFFFDFNEDVLHITTKQIKENMLNNRYSLGYIKTECKNSFGVDFLKDESGEPVITWFTYKWKEYIDTENSGYFIDKKSKWNGQALVFNREKFLSNYEINSLRQTNQSNHIDLIDSTVPTVPIDPIDPNLNLNPNAALPF